MTLGAAVIVGLLGLVAHLVIASVVVSWVRSAHQSTASAEVHAPRPSADAVPKLEGAAS